MIPWKLGLADCMAGQVGGFQNARVSISSRPISRAAKTFKILNEPTRKCLLHRLFMNESGHRVNSYVVELELSFQNPEFKILEANIHKS